MNEAIFDHEKLDASLSTSTKKSQNQAMHLLVDSLTAPLDLRLRLTTNGSDCHELDITLKITAKDVRSSAKLTTDMFVRNHNVIG